MDGQETVLSSQHGHVRVLTLNRPDSLNAIDDDLATALGDAVAAAEDHVDTRVIVLTGAGRAFCAGMDLKAFARGESAMSRTKPERGFAGIAQHLVQKPVIAAVNGAAYGLGAEIVLACDMAVMDHDARFALPEVRVGLLAAAGGAMRLAQQIPLKIAMEMLLTGEALTAGQAARWGLVNAVAPPGRALERAISLGTRIAANAPLAVQATKVLAQATAHADGWEPSVWETIRDAQDRIFSSRDAVEGAEAFAAKRFPQWQGS